MGQSVIERVLVCPSLPSLPGVAIEVLELSRDPDVPMKEIAGAVENDQALAVKILKTVNSSYYGLSKPCSTIMRAMGYLGLSTVKSLVLGFSLVDSFKNNGEGGFDFESHWQRALYCAAGSRLLARRGGAKCDPDEAFISALMQDVGQLAMVLALGEEYLSAIYGFKGGHSGVCAQERDILEVDHAEVGARLTEKWNLPGSMSAVIRSHHSVDKAPPAHLELVRVVALSGMIAEMLASGNKGSARKGVQAKAREWFGFDDKSLQGVIEELVEGATELGKLFQVPTGEKPNVSMLMGEAQEQLVEHQLSVERKTSELTKQVTMDALTGAANRKRFDELMQEGWSKAEQGACALSVVFCDADKFKSVNDTYGHQAGDEVLVQLAKVLTEVVGDRGTVCRYGGEEFALVLEGHRCDSAVAIAEEIRVAVEAHVVDVRQLGCGTDELRVTLSLGVSGVSDAKEAEAVGGAAQLVKLADDGVYRAKEGGRNQVCIGTGTKMAQDDGGAAVPAMKPAAQQTPATGTPRMRILLVEDDSLHAKLVETPLENVRDIEMRVASTGERAIEMLGESGYEPDLVLCDLGLPGIGGEELIGRIRGEERKRAVPIVVLTSTEGTEAAAACFAAGANAFIPKSRIADDPKRRVLQIMQFWSIARAA